MDKKNYGQVFKKLKDFYNEYAKYYEKIYRDYLEKSENSLRSIYEKYLNNHSDKKWMIIDLGCGTGRQLKFFKDILGNKCLKAIGIDISESMIKLAKNKYYEIEWLEMDMLKLDKNWVNCKIKEIKDTSNVEMLITCLGNTLAHLPYEEYEGFGTVLKNICISKNSLVVLEIRNGEKLKEEKPAIEILSIPNNKDFSFSFYHMHHKDNIYPTDVYFVDEKGTIKKWSNEISYYVLTEKLRNVLEENFDITKETEIQSYLRYGEIWILKLRN